MPAKSSGSRDRQSILEPRQDEDFGPLASEPDLRSKNASKSDFYHASSLTMHVISPHEAQSLSKLLIDSDEVEDLPVHTRHASAFPQAPIPPAGSVGSYPSRERDKSHREGKVVSKSFIVLLNCF